MKNLKLILIILPMLLFFGGCKNESDNLEGTLWICYIQQNGASAEEALSFYRNSLVKIDEIVTISSNPGSPTLTVSIQGKYTYSSSTGKVNYTYKIGDSTYVYSGTIVGNALTVVKNDSVTSIFKKQ